jgi:CxxH/CxxC protein (TIGR04129 family)
MDRVIYSCTEHIEDLLDVFLDEVEEMPVIEKVAHTEVVCHECQKQAFYKLSGSEVKTKWE